LKPLLAPAHGVAGEPHNASFQPDWINGRDETLPAPPIIEHKPLTVSFQDVTFRYPGASQPALKNVSIDIPAGAFIAITGPVGCGKSALLRVVLGLYPLENGQIRINELLLSQIPKEVRTSQVGYLPQDPFLFSGTVRENISFGMNSIDETRIAKAATTAILDQDLITFPLGIDTQIGELGTLVSGGQRQRVALARSLAAPPTPPGLLILDDPFSAVDLDTESLLIESLRQAFGPDAPQTQRATLLLSSHRLAAFPQADRIIVLDQGRILETGTHSELMAAGGLYSRIYKAQALVSRANGNGHDGGAHA
jgi:ABC-type multidrug transport system fused ATPase/permease subunit